MSERVVELVRQYMDDNECSVLAYVTMTLGHHDATACSVYYGPDKVVPTHCVVVHYFNGLGIGTIVIPVNSEGVQYIRLVDKRAITPVYERVDWVDTETFTYTDVLKHIESDSLFDEVVWKVEDL